MCPARTAALLLSALALVTLTSCRIESDVGTPCILVKANPEGGLPLEIGETELEVGKDYVSFGAVECENLVCVRHADFDPDWSGGTPGIPAQGYCSKSCVPGSESITTGCLTEPANDVAGDPFSCRGLILDEDTLAALCAEDPEACQATFGDNRDPYFCARGAEAL